jgi:predicted CopG family antitoxin
MDSQCLYKCVDVNTCMPVKTVTLSEDAYAALAALKKEGESFSEVVRRLTRQGKSLLEFAGAWKDFPRDKMDRYLAFLEEGDRLSTDKLARGLRNRK